MKPPVRGPRRRVEGRDRAGLDNEDLSVRDAPLDVMTPTERYGVGQSGYTAGRVEDDPALDREVQTRNATYPKGTDDEEQLSHELATDDRFTGRGGPLTSTPRST